MKPTNSVVISRSVVLRSIVLGLILIYRNWAVPWWRKPLAASSVSVARAFWDFTLSCLFALSPQILEQKRDFLFCYAPYGNTRTKAEYLRPKFQNNSNIVMSRSTVVNIFVVYVNSSIDDEPGEPAHYSSREKTEKVFKKPKIIIWGLKKKSSISI